MGTQHKVWGAIALGLISIGLPISAVNAGNTRVNL